MAAAIIAAVQNANHAICRKSGLVDGRSGKPRYEQAAMIRKMPIPAILAAVPCMAMAQPAEPQDGGLAAPVELQYPPRALREGVEGDVTIRLTVTPEGAVRRCEIVASSGFTMLDEATCWQYTRFARFHPARDDDGNPVEEIYSQLVRWRLADIRDVEENSPLQPS